MTTPIAPASLALRALTAKPQRPRSTRAIRPATAAALVKGLQPSVDVPPTSTASTAAATLPDTFGLPMVGPKAAVPNCSTPAMLAGVSICADGLPSDSTDGAFAVTPAPSHTTRPKRVADARRSALVICGQYLFSVVSSSLVLYASGRPASSAPLVKLAFWLNP